MKKWKQARYQTVMPAQFMGNGLISSDERFYVAARFVGSGSHNLNWGALDLLTHTFADEFRYRRDAIAFVEKGGFGS